MLRFEKLLALFFFCLQLRLELLVCNQDGLGVLILCCFRLLGLFEVTLYHLILLLQNVELGLERADHLAILGL